MKKRYFHIFLSLLLPAGIFAQNMNDVFQYNQTSLNGTARYMGTAGVISQIGADLSAVSDNPAGAAAFVSNRFSWTPTAFNNSNTGIYNGDVQYSEANSIYKAPFYTNQWGVVFPYVSSTKKWNKMAFGITGRADYHYLNEIKTFGQASTMQSVADYFLFQAEGVPTGDLVLGDDETVTGVYSWLGENYGSYAQKAFLAYQGYIIDPLNNDATNTQYVSNASYSVPLYHGLKENLDGKKFSHDIFFAAEYDKKLSIGASLTLRKMNYNQTRVFTEEGYDASSTLQYVKYTTTLQNDASGFQMKFGMMYKLNDRLRISASYHSPTWWENEETTGEGLYTEALDRDDLDDDGDTDELNIFELYPDTKNVYDKYTYMEPGLWQAGLSYVFPKAGFIAVDYAYRDWSMTHFSDPNGYEDVQAYFDLLNTQIKETYTAQHRLRIGGELKLEEWAVRLGVFQYTSPYKNYPDYSTRGYSFGLGYDFGNVELDFGWLHSNSRYAGQLFPVGLTENYEVTSVRNKYAFTVRYNF